MFVYGVVLLISVACLVNAKEDLLRAYTLRKDFFNGLKAAEFSVFDISKKTLYYRIESKFTFLPTFELIAYPSKQVIAKLESKIGLINLSLLDDKTGQWIIGSMKRHFSLLNNEYTIQLNGRQISMKKELLSAHTNFRDKSQGDDTLLARFQREFFSPITATTYGVQIYSNDIPDSLYLLALAWSDIGRSEDYGGSRRKLNF